MDCRNLPDFPDESQSSQLSSASATNEGRERKRGKMEVCEPEGYVLTSQIVNSFYCCQIIPLQSN